MRVLCLVLLLSGCAYKVRLVSEPDGALFTLPDGSLVSSPAEVTVRWVPFGSQPLVCEAPGYRTLELDLRRDEVRWSHYLRDTLVRPRTLFGEPRGTVRLVLVPEHGGVGTWDASNVP